MNLEDRPERRFERSVQARLDVVYDLLGWEADRADECRAFDLHLRAPHLGVVTVEEKVVRWRRDPKIVVELLQDTDTGSLGYLYQCFADRLHYVQCENDGTPHTLWCGNWPQFKEAVLLHLREGCPEIRWVRSGWGNTLVALVSVFLPGSGMAMVDLTDHAWRVA